MKKIISLLCLCLGIMGGLQAQQKVSDKAVINVPGLHCDMDKERLINYLGHQSGITSVKADVKKKTVTVTWLTDRTNIEEIKTAIANRGYDADDVTAEETAQKRLPAACRPVKPGTEPAKPTTGTTTPDPL